MWGLFTTCATSVRPETLLPVQVSWCKVEVELPNAKGIRPAAPGTQLAARASPPLTVAALNLRLHMDPKTQQQEILAASVVHMSGALGHFLRPRVH